MKSIKAILKRASDELCSESHEESIYIRIGLDTILDDMYQEDSNVLLCLYVVYQNIVASYNKVEKECKRYKYATKVIKKALSMLFEEDKSTTNRDWLETMSNYEFADWVFNTKKGDSSLHTLANSYTDSTNALADWLSLPNAEMYRLKIKEGKEGK